MSPLKTKQIGIMKAIGARNSAIMQIFIFNAAIIGLVGGLLGVAFGYLGAEVLTIAMGSEAIVTIEVVLIALGVSVFVGLVAGIVPAYQASQLNPVDALRYE